LGVSDGLGDEFDELGVLLMDLGVSVGLDEVVTLIDLGVFDGLGDEFDELGVLLMDLGVSDGLVEGVTLMDFGVSNGFGDRFEFDTRFIAERLGSLRWLR